MSGMVKYLKVAIAREFGKINCQPYLFEVHLNFLIVSLKTLAI